MNDKEDVNPTSPLVRYMRSTVGRESTTFGFSILATATFGLLQTSQGSPNVLQIFMYAIGAVMSFTLLGGALSSGFLARAALTLQPCEGLGLNPWDCVGIMLVSAAGAARVTPRAEA